jgi:membrane protease YdiL (CAAX protease family)
LKQAEAPGNSAADAIMVTAICFGWFILGSIQAVASGFPTRPFSDSFLVGIIVLEGILAITAIGYLLARGYNLAQLLPVPTAIGCLVGLGLYVTTVLVSWPLKFLIAAGHPVAQPVEHMVANATVSFLPVVAVSVVNGLYEEVFLVGYLQRALESSGVVFAIGGSVLVRLLYHLYQGPSAAISVLGFGLILSAYFGWKRKLWPIVFAHTIADIAGFSLR